MTTRTDDSADGATFRASWAVFALALALVSVIGIGGVVLVATSWGPAAVGTGLALVGLAALAGWFVAQANPGRRPLLFVDSEGLRIAALERFIPWRAVRAVRPTIALDGLRLEVTLAGGDDARRPGEAEAVDVLPVGAVHGSPKAVSDALSRFAPEGIEVSPPHHGWRRRLPMLALVVWVFGAFALAAASEGGGTIAAAHNILGNAFLKGVVVSQDSESAARHFHKAALRGSASAAGKLRYLELRGIERPNT